MQPRTPIIVVEDDRVLRQVEVVLDPRTSAERVAAYANYVAHDLPDWHAWREALRTKLPRLHPAEVRLVDSQDQLRAALPGADVAVVESLEVGPEELALCPTLRVVQKFGMAGKNVDLAACSQRGIQVLDLRRRTNIALAEHTLMFMLALARRFPYVNHLVTPERLHAAGIPQSPYDTRHTASANFGRIPGLKMLHGRTLGLLGFGEIGQETARLAHAFGMRVLYNKRHRLSGAEESAMSVAYRDFDALFAESDFLSVHVPMGPATRSLVDARAIGLMPAGAFLINTSRAEIVERTALLQGLQSGHLGGLALDVLYQEPDTEADPLLGFSNVLLTPHIAGASRMNGLADIEDMLVQIQGALA
jgi:phosphoglycerate dehydrogenase-like enzyme